MAGKIIMEYAGVLFWVVLLVAGVAYIQSELVASLVRDINTLTSVLSGGK